MSTSPSAWRHPFFDSGRSTSGPSQCLRLPARPWRTKRTVTESASRREGVQDLPISGVGQRLFGRLDGQPADLVHLPVGTELAAGHAHGPVAHVLRPTVAVVVIGGRKLLAERHLQAGLLLDLVYRRLLGRFAVVELALG